jgi:hypothetical protein
VVRRRRRDPVLLRLYTRDGCGLCRRAERLIADEARDARLELVDIGGDDELERRYGVRIPVLEIDGTEVAAYELAPGDVRRAIRAARRRR